MMVRAHPDLGTAGIAAGGDGENMVRVQDSRAGIREKLSESAGVGRCLHTPSHRESSRGDGQSRPLSDYGAL